METAILKSDLKLLMDLAKKIGVKSTILSADEMEEYRASQGNSKGKDWRIC